MVSKHTINIKLQQRGAVAFSHKTEVDLLLVLGVDYKEIPCEIYEVYNQNDL